MLSDGWTKDDLVYVWRDDEPVQLAGNLSLPGGFQLGAYGSEYCDVKTATGEFGKLSPPLRQFYQVNHNSLMWDWDWGFQKVFESTSLNQILINGCFAREPLVQIFLTHHWSVCTSSTIRSSHLDVESGQIQNHQLITASSVFLPTKIKWNIFSQSHLPPLDLSNYFIKVFSVILVLLIHASNNLREKNH